MDLSEPCRTMEVKTSFKCATRDTIEANLTASTDRCLDQDRETNTPSTHVTWRRVDGSWEDLGSLPASERYR